MKRRKSEREILEEIIKIVKDAVDRYIKETGNYISAKELKNRKRK